jgi:hypothetical protein
MIERYVREKSYRQISGALSIPITLVSYRINEGKKMLREEFNKMDNNMKGYYEPTDMQVDIRYSGRGNCHDKSYRAMDSLLAKNIAFVCYDEPLTVTEIAHALGVPADYVEDTIAKMLNGYCLERKANRYQTAFPIITERILEQIKDIAVRSSAQMYENIVSKMQEALPALEALKLSRKKALFFLFDVKGYIGELSPYDADFEYPCHENEDNWVIKGYLPNSDAVCFPLDKYHVGGGITDNEGYVGFHFELSKSPLWMDAANNPDCCKAVCDIADGKTPVPGQALGLLVRAGIVNDLGELTCLVFASADEFRTIAEPVRQAAELEYELTARTKDEVTLEVKKLFPKRFDNLEPYINCEIRNFILAGFEEYLLVSDLIESLPYIVLERGLVKSQGDSSETMY